MALELNCPFLKQDMHNVKERVTAAEQRISDLEDTIHPLEGLVQNIQKEVAAHTDKLGGYGRPPKPE